MPEDGQKGKNGALPDKNVMIFGIQWGQIQLLFSMNICLRITLTNTYTKSADIWQYKKLALYLSLSIN